MSFSAAQDLKEQVRAATDIVALVGSERPVIQKGRDYVALCPFHDDHDPSLVLNQQRQTWRCWTCGDGGDVFSYVMKRESIDFRGALQILADRAGIELRNAGPKAKPGSPNDKATLYKAMAWAETQFHRFLLEGAEAAPAREYLQKRQINAESIEQYKIGYAPNEWQWLLDRARSTSFTPAVLEAIGLVKFKEGGGAFDFFRGRVMFPIRDTQDRPIAVGGRILPQFADERAAKYFNSTETRLYSKSEQLYGLNVCRADLDQLRREKKSRNVIVMEGYTDVVVSRQAGVATPIAVCGTALTEKHVQVLRRFADRVTLILDGDAAGKEKAAKVLELFVAGQIELRIVTLPDGLDPCDYALQNGAEAMYELIEQAPDALEFCVDNETRGIDLARDSVRANQALDRILATMAKAPRLKEDTDTTFRLREQQTLSRMVRMFRVDEAQLRGRLSELRAQNHKNKIRFGGDQEAVADKPTLHSWEADLFALLIQHPDAIAAVIENVAETDMRTELGKALLVVYQDLEADGRTADIAHVLPAVEDPHMKSILVELAEDVDRKQGEDAELQLRELLAAFGNRRLKKERQGEKAELESGSLSEEQERELLRRLFPPTNT